MCQETLGAVSMELINQNTLVIGTQSGILYSTTINKTNGVLTFSNLSIFLIHRSTNTESIIFYSDNESEINLEPVSIDNIICFDQSYIAILSNSNIVTFYSISHNRETNTALTPIVAIKLDIGNSLHYAKHKEAHCWMANGILLVSCSDGAIICIHACELISSISKLKNHVNVIYKEFVYCVHKEHSLIVQLKPHSTHLEFCICAYNRNGYIYLKQTFNNNRESYIDYYYTASFFLIGRKDRCSGIYGTCYCSTNKNLFSARPGRRIFHIDKSINLSSDSSTTEYILHTNTTIKLPAQKGEIGILYNVTDIAMPTDVHINDSSFNYNEVLLCIYNRQKVSLLHLYNQTWVELFITPECILSTLFWDSNLLLMINNRIEVISIDKASGNIIYPLVYNSNNSITHPDKSIKSANNPVKTSFTSVNLERNTNNANDELNVIHTISNDKLSTSQIEICNSINTTQLNRSDKNILCSPNSNICNKFVFESNILNTSTKSMRNHSYKRKSIYQLSAVDFEEPWSSSNTTNRLSESDFIHQIGSVVYKDTAENLKLITSTQLVKVKESLLCVKHSDILTWNGNSKPISNLTNNTHNTTLLSSESIKDGYEKVPIQNNLDSVYIPINRSEMLTQLRTIFVGVFNTFPLNNYQGRDVNSSTLKMISPSKIQGPLIHADAYTQDTSQVPLGADYNYQSVSLTANSALYKSLDIDKHPFNDILSIFDKKTKQLSTKVSDFRLSSNPMPNITSNCAYLLEEIYSWCMHDVEEALNNEANRISLENEGIIGHISPVYFNYEITEVVMSLLIYALKWLQFYVPRHFSIDVTGLKILELCAKLTKTKAAVLRVYHIAIEALAFSEHFIIKILEYSEFCIRQIAASTSFTLIKDDEFCFPSLYDPANIHKWKFSSTETLGELENTLYYLSSNNEQCEYYEEKYNHLRERLLENTALFLHYFPYLFVVHPFRCLNLCLKVLPCISLWFIEWATSPLIFKSATSVILKCNPSAFILLKEVDLHHFLLDLVIHLIALMNTEDSKQLLRVDTALSTRIVFIFEILCKNYHQLNHLANSLNTKNRNRIKNSILQLITHIKSLNTDMVLEIEKCILPLFIKYEFIEGIFQLKREHNVISTKIAENNFAIVYAIINYKLTSQLIIDTIKISYKEHLLNQALLVLISVTECNIPYIIHFLFNTLSQLLLTPGPLYVREYTESSEYTKEQYQDLKKFLANFKSITIDMQLQNALKKLYHLL